VADLLDRVYDTLHQGAAVVGTALGVDMSDVMPPKRAEGSPRGLQGAPFRIEEVIDGATGKMVYTVTDGHGTSCDAPTRADAEATLDALESKRAMVVRAERTESRSGSGSGTGSGSGQRQSSP
jgi:hypothetical protein